MLVEQSSEMGVMVDAVESLWEKVMDRVGCLTGKLSWVVANGSWERGC
jgi:hypothetical protein